MENVKYLYLRDKDDPRHVLSFGRVVVDDGNCLLYSMCLNRVEHGVVLDDFCKKKAHNILSGKLNSKRERREVFLSKGERIIDAMLYDAANLSDIPSSAKKILKQHVKV